MKKIIAIILISMIGLTNLVAEDVVKYDKPKVEDKSISKPNHPNTGKDIYSL